MIKSLVAVLGVLVIGFVVLNFSTLSSFLPSNQSNSFNQTNQLKDNNQSQQLSEFELRGSAMEPNFHDRDLCKLDSNAYESGLPSRGDVVLFTGISGVGKNIELVKRVIGLPSERVMLNGGKVYINGIILHESYLSSSTTTSGGKFMKDGDGFVIPAGNYFLAGDNRPHSSDSREFGFIDLSNIHGKIISCKTP